jgi:hypothetical protein
MSQQTEGEEKEEPRLVKRMRVWLAFEVPKLSDFLWTVPQVSGCLQSSIRVRKSKPMRKVLQLLASALALFNVIHLPLKLSLDAFRQRWCDIHHN